MAEGESAKVYSTRYIIRLPSGHISRVEIVVDEFGKLIKASNVESSSGINVDFEWQEE